MPDARSKRIGSRKSAPGLSRSAPPGRRRWLIGGVTALVAVVITIGLVLAGRSEGRGQGAVPGDRAVTSSTAGGYPDFPVILYQGGDILGVASQQVPFSQILGDKPVVVNYWASNCPPCTAEMPEFEKVWRRYKDRVLFVGLDVGRFFPGFGGPVASKRELEFLGISYVAGTPPSVDVVRRLQVASLPSTVFLTPDGGVFRRWAGILNEARLTELVEELLKAS